MDLTLQWRFLKGYMRNPSVVGAIAPSSRALASALCEPFRRHPHPARLLEVGAGTGSITRHLGSILGEEDELDICEVEPEFVNILERDVLSRPDFASAIAAGRVRLFQAPVQDLPGDNQYDFVISGLPLTTFAIDDVRRVFNALRRSLKPGGVLSYFEYLGLRKASRLLTVGRNRRRIRTVSAFLSRTIREHEFGRQTVLRNLPPAHARHLRFDG